MRSKIKRTIRKVIPFAFLNPEGDEGMAKLSHRGYIGGRWDEIGKLQFDFLVSKGLKPHHALLDIACGSVRLGIHAIPYLDQSCYLGLEKESGMLSGKKTNDFFRNDKSS